MIPPTAAAKTRRGRSMFAILVAVVALAVGVAAYVRSVRRMEETIRSVQAAGGAAYLSHQIRDGRLVAQAEPDLPSWVASRSPRAARFVHSLAYIDLRGPHFDDQHVKALLGAPWLQWLALSSSQVSDAGVRMLPELTPRLVRLELENTQITDVSIDSLAELKQLQWLFLDGTRITSS
ncbi:MAG: leucine-rich repeat domain-containing protein, partial [Planctomycetales bacterium]|nr:leucine-rich repeat domain-containing protein [Planctomycetales bacterium]